MGASTIIQSATMKQMWSAYARFPSKMTRVIPTRNSYGQGWGIFDTQTNHGPENRQWSRDGYFLHTGIVYKCKNDFMDYYVCRWSNWWNNGFTIQTDKI